MPTRAASARTHARRRVFRRLLLVAGLSLAAGVTGLVAVLTLMHATPSWWRSMASADASSRSRGENVENAVLTEMSRPRDRAAGQTGPWRSEPWTVAITDEDATAWLNTRLYRWLVNQKRDDLWPGNIEQLQCAFEPGRVLLGAKVRVGASSQVISLTLRPMIGEPGPEAAPLFMTARGFAVGRVPVPLRWLFAAEQTEQSRTLDAILAGNKPLAGRAVVDIDGARRVRVLSLAPVRGELRVTCVTEVKSP